MGHLGEPKVGAPFGDVGPEWGDAPGVGLEKRLEGQDGEELVLSEVRAAAHGGRGR